MSAWQRIKAFWAELKRSLRRWRGFDSARDMAQASPDTPPPAPAKPPTQNPCAAWLLLALIVGCAGVDGARLSRLPSGALDVVVDVDTPGPAQVGVYIDGDQATVCAFALLAPHPPQCVRVPVRPAD